MPTAWNAFTNKMSKPVRLLRAYQRITAELSEVPHGMLGELGTGRSAILDFAWRCARLEIEQETLVGRGDEPSPSIVPAIDTGGIELESQEALRGATRAEPRVDTKLSA
jgi:hypothetical protein